MQLPFIYTRPPKLLICLKCNLPTYLPSYSLFYFPCSLLTPHDVFTNPWVENHLPLRLTNWDYLFTYLTYLPYRPFTYLMTSFLPFLCLPIYPLTYLPRLPQTSISSLAFITQLNLPTYSPVYPSNYPPVLVTYMPLPSTAITFKWPVCPLP